MNVDLTRVQKIIEWAKTQIFLDAKSSSAKSRLVKRGQHWYRVPLRLMLRLSGFFLVWILLRAEERIWSIMLLISTRIVESFL